MEEQQQQQQKNEEQKKNISVFNETLYENVK